MLIPAALGAFSDDLSVFKTTLHGRRQTLTHLFHGQYMPIQIQDIYPSTGD
jgi:hypothetical protein